MLKGNIPYHSKKEVSGVQGTPFFVIFTDLDGTLLDHTSYSWSEAVPALNLCKKHSVPVVLVSSKTRAEMEFLRRQLGLSDPLISENGGGIFFPGDSFEKAPPGALYDRGMWKWSMGTPYGRVVEALQDIRRDLGWIMRGFSDMGVEEISSLTGLDHESARLAAMREYDEPFIILQEPVPDKKLLIRAAAARGLQVTAGGRFQHLHGNSDKGRSMARLASWYRQRRGEIVTVALGDSPNDFPMLERADYPCLIGSPESFPGLKEKIPGLKATREKGPKGWNEAVREIVR